MQLGKKEKFMKLKFMGFTLAEVLITLGIIGVVAAMTIPTLIANNQKQQLLSGLKKFYSIYNNALTQYAADNGCVGDLKCTGFTMMNTTAEMVALGNALTSGYIKTSKICGQLDNTSADNDCFAPITKGLNGQAVWSSNLNTAKGCGNTHYKFVTADGMSVALMICGDGVIVDVNGTKPPNTDGRDIFAFLYSQNGTKITPNTGYSATNCGASTGSIFSCTRKILEDGWQMNY